MLPHKRSVHPENRAIAGVQHFLLEFEIYPFGPKYKTNRTLLISIFKVFVTLQPFFLLEIAPSLSLVVPVVMLTAKIQNAQLNLNFR